VKKPGIIAWCWLWYLLAQCADMLTSLARWGGEEMNPFFRDSHHIFVASHALVGKGALTFISGAVSYFLYKLVEPLNKPMATILACIAPLLYGWLLWSVAQENLFVILRWVNP
jgi:hypothetical protein